MISKMTVLAQSVAAPNVLEALTGGVTGIIGLIIFVLLVIGWWRMFTKAGYPGWLAIIPIVNLIVYALMSKRSLLWLILLLIPVVNIFALFYIHMGVAERFGQSILFAIGLFFLTPIFVLLLGFGDYQYRG